MDGLTLRAVVTDPFVQTGALAVVGALVSCFLLRRYPARRLGFEAGLFVVLSLLLWRHGIVPYEIAPDTTPAFQRLFVALAKIIWWVNGAWVLTGVARVFLIFRHGSREGRLVQDVVVGIIYLGAALSIVAYVFNAPIGTLIATSGVFAIILGLALQNTLGDVFSGIALDLSKPYDIGDWIVLGDGLEGRVVETSWRATYLLSASNDLVVLPNSGLAKAQLTNFSNPNRSHGVKLRVRMAPTKAPSAISEVMATVLLSSNSILPAPAPTVEIKSLDAQAIEFELAFRVKDFSVAATARHEVYDLIYRHARAAGLALAPAAQDPTAAFAPLPAPAAAATRPTALRMVDAVPLFTSLTEEEKATLAETMTRKVYRKGEVLAEQGARLVSLVVIRSGVVVIEHRDSDHDVEIGRLAPGDYFGEAGLFAGTGEAGTVRALTSVVVYELAQAALATLMQDRPSIADEISVTLSRRAKAGTTTGRHETMETRSVTRLLASIRELFEVPHV